MSFWRKLSGKADIAKPGKTQPKYVPLTGHVGVVRAVGASADGSIIATGSYDAAVRLWNPTTGQEVGKFNADSDIGTLAMSPNGTKVVIGCKSNFVEVWEVQSGKRLIQMRGHKSFPCSSMDYSKDGRWAASASWDEPEVFLWDLKDGDLERQIVPEGVRPKAVRVAFALDSTKLAIGDDEGVFIYEVQSGKLGARLDSPGGSCKFVKYLDDDTIASIRGYRSSNVNIQNVSRKAMLKQQRFEKPKSATAGAVSDDGRRVAIGEFGTVSEWDLETGSAVMERTQAHGDNQIMAVMYVPGTHTWVSCDEAGSVILWNPVGPIVAPSGVPAKTPADRIRELEESLKQRPDWADGHDNLAREYWHQGDVVNMFHHFHAAAHWDPDSNQPHKYLKEIYEILGRYDDYARESAEDKRTDPHAHVGGTVLAPALCVELQKSAWDHKEELLAVIRELGA